MKNLVLSFALLNIANYNLFAFDHLIKKPLDSLTWEDLGVFNIENFVEQIKPAGLSDSSALGLLDERRKLVDRLVENSHRCRICGKSLFAITQAPGHFGLSRIIGKRSRADEEHVSFLREIKDSGEYLRAFEYYENQLRLLKSSSGK